MCVHAPYRRPSRVFHPLRRQLPTVNVTVAAPPVLRDAVICFDPRPCYSHRALDANSRRYGAGRDDNLARVHPGIEPWLDEQHPLFRRLACRPA